MRLHFLLAGAVLCVGLGACGGSDSADASCASSDGAKVCLVHADGGLELRTSGLRPRSALVVTSKLGPDPQTYPIGDDGSIDGTVGFLGDGTDHAVLTVTGVAAGGESFEGTLTSDR